jgi:hypothetical protein
MKKIIVTLVLTNLIGGAANASGPQCFNPCPHQHHDTCINPPAVYYACLRNLEPLPDDDARERAYLCAVESEEQRRSRRSKLIYATDARWFAIKNNAPVCQ